MRVFLGLLFFIVSVFAKVNINTASVKELKTLKGIGISKAKAIVEYRKEHKFEKIEDIMKVKGIGKKLFENIKGEISVKDDGNKSDKKGNKK